MNNIDNANPSRSTRARQDSHAGPHTVGTTKLELRIAAGPKHSGTIVTQLWYPANGATTTWWTRAQNWLGILRHPTWAPARHGAPIIRSLKAIPAIIYVPGSDHHDDNTFMLANLASHGFIVAAIDDPFRRDKGGEPPYRHDAGADELHNYRRLCVARGVRTASLFLDALQHLKLEARRNAYTDSIDPSRVGNHWICARRTGRRAIDADGPLCRRRKSRR